MSQVQILSPRPMNLCVRFVGARRSCYFAGALLASGFSGLEATRWLRSEEHTSELQSQSNLVCRLLLEKKKEQYAEQRPLSPGGALLILRERRAGATVVAVTPDFTDRGSSAATRSSPACGHRDITHLPD